MDEKSLYARILNLSAAWQVQSLSLDEKSGSVTVIVRLVGHTQMTCPTCVKSCSIHDHRRRKWRHLDTCQFTRWLRLMSPALTAQTTIAKHWRFPEYDC